MGTRIVVNYLNAFFYENQLDASPIGTTSEGTVIGGGSILIHAK